MSSLKALWLESLISDSLVINNIVGGGLNKWAKIIIKKNHVWYENGHFDFLLYHINLIQDAY